MAKKPLGYILSHQFPPNSEARLLLHSQTASDRLRGLQISLDERFAWRCGRPILKGFDIDLLFVGKPPARDSLELSKWLAVVELCWRAGKLVFLDITDNHLDGQDGVEIKAFYKQALSRSHLVTTSSVSLEKLVRKLSPGLKTQVIEDPIEQAPVSPKREMVHAVPVGLWFGHSQNIGYLRQYIERNATLFRERRLIILTNGEWFAREGLSVGAWTQLTSGPLVYCYPWSSRALQEAGELCDYALLPSDVNDPRKNGASQNRLFSSLTLGLPTIASPIPSHLHFSDFWTSTEDLPLVESVMNNPLALSDQPKKFQLDVYQRYSPSAIQKQWGSLLSKTF